MIPAGPRDLPAGWRGAIEWEHAEGWSRPWRLPIGLAPLAHAPELVERAQMAAGIRAVLETDAEWIEIELDAEEFNGEVSPLDVLAGGVLIARHRLAAGRHRLRTDLPAGSHRVELWLPQHGRCRVGGVTLGGTTRPAGIPAAGPRWITYGSSITHCRAAAGPSETWPALVARRLDLDLVCLGLGSQCHLDPVIAETISATPATVISLCLGINVYGAATYNLRSFAGQVSGFVRTIRTAQPRAQIVVMSPISSPAREHKPNAATLTLGDYRDQVAEATQLLRERGDTALTLIDGRDVFGPADAELLVDGLHPGPGGYRLMAERLMPRIAALPS